MREEVALEAGHPLHGSVRGIAEFNATVGLMGDYKAARTRYTKHFADTPAGSGTWSNM
jgi:hypothetical protein